MKVLLSALRDSLGLSADSSSAPATSDVRDRGGVRFPNYKDFDPTLPIADRDGDNAVLAALADLDPSGVWPPVADFDRWPECCLPFAELCDSMGERLMVYPPPKAEDVPVDGPSKHLQFRRWMKTFLDERVDLDEVMAALDSDDVGSATRLGLVGCFTMLSLAYRWGAIPVVAAATNETTLGEVDFPPAIRRPYVALCDYYGIVAAPASFPFMMGNLQWPTKHQPEFRCRFCFHKTNPNLQLESTFRAAISLSEITGVQAYKAMARVVGAMDAGDAAAVEKAMTEVSDGVKEVFKVIFEQFVHGTHDMKRLFVLYIQEPSGWGLDGLHGLSASQLLSLRAMDAFCSFENNSQMAGMILELDHYTTAPMRRFTNALREARVGARLAEDRRSGAATWTPATYRTFEEMVRRVRMFRQSHRRFVDAYITRGQKMDRPTVTSLNGLLYSEYDESRSLAPVVAKDEKQDSTVTMDEMLAGRVEETVVPWRDPARAREQRGVGRGNVVLELPTIVEKAAMSDGSTMTSATSSSSLSDMSASTASTEIATPPAPRPRAERMAPSGRAVEPPARESWPFGPRGTVPAAAFLGAALVAGLRTRTIAYVCFEEPSLVVPSATGLFCLVAATLATFLWGGRAKANATSSIREKTSAPLREAAVSAEAPPGEGCPEEERDFEVGSIREEPRAPLREAAASAEGSPGKGCPEEERDFEVFLAFARAPRDADVDPKEHLARVRAAVSRASTMAAGGEEEDRAFAAFLAFAGGEGEADVGPKERRARARSSVFLDRAPRDGSPTRQ